MSRSRRPSSAAGLGGGISRRRLRLWAGTGPAAWPVLILVLEHGASAEEGTHEALLQRGGLYRELYRAQLRRQDWELV
jgi:hypothetical protein